MNKYDGIEEERAALLKFKKKYSPVVIEVYKLEKQGVFLLRHKVFYARPSDMIQAAFPNAGEEVWEYESIQMSHSGREVMNNLGRNTMYAAFTDNECKSDRFVIIPFSEKERIQEILLLPHIERTSASDTEEGEKIYKGLIEHNEFEAYDHRDFLNNFGLKPKDVEIDILNKTISIVVINKYSVGDSVSIPEFLKNLDIMGFSKVYIDLRKTGAFLGEDDKAKFIDRSKTWIPDCDNIRTIYIDVSGCPRIKSDSGVMRCNLSL